MKLFKKRDTHGSNLSASPAGSLDRTNVNQAQLQQSPTPSTGAGAQQQYSNSGSTNGGPSSRASQSQQSGRESALQYPWSSRRISKNNPFPRYGHATNSQSGKEGGIYVFGGLVKEKAMQDLWVMAPSDLQARAISTSGEMPSPRVGHAALLIGNAFIVFGGDTKLNGLDNNPNNDDSLYLLNTSTKIWTVAKVAGAKPSGRYGHTLNMLGPKVLVFGGQVEGFFFNDLVAFDLNTLNNAAPRWELITPIEGSEPPPSRTNHVAIAHNDKLYIFGGTNGQEWFNDMWRFDPVTRSWQLVNCSGYVPQPREGHSASLVGDVIYVFGGRDVDGNDLGDLSAFKISSARWFTFQNMGPGPSARSGHALCTVGKKVYVVGGEGASTHGDEQHAYILDTTKIRYPAETKQPLKENEPQTNSLKDSSIDGSPVPTPRGPPEIAQAPTIRSVSGQGTTTPSRLPQSNSQRPNTREIPQYQQGARRASAAVIPSRENQIRPPGAPASQQRNVSSPNPITNQEPQYGLLNDTENRPPVKRSGSLDSMMELNETVPNDEPEQRLNKVRSLEDMKRRPSATPETRNINTVIASDNETSQLAPALRHLDSGNIMPLAPPALTSKSSKRLSRRLSSYEDQGNYTTRIAWLEAELNLARKAGYTFSDDSQTVETDVAGAETDVTRALIGLRNQLLSVKEDTRRANAEALEKISIATSERDAALRETAYEKARNMALISLDAERLQTIELQRNQELEVRLVDASTQTKSLERQIFSLQSDLASTRRTREDHDVLLQRHNDAATEAERKHAELLSQHNTMRGLFSETQGKMQEHQAKRIEAESALSSRELDAGKLRDLEEQHSQHIQAFELSNKASAAATARASRAEISLDAEVQKTAALQAQLSDLSTQLETVKSDLAQQRAMKEQMEAQMLTAREEAETSRTAMAGGIESLLTRHEKMGPHDPIHHQTSVDNLSRELSSIRDLHQSSHMLLEGHERDLQDATDRLAVAESTNTQKTNDMLALQRRLAENQSQLQDLQAKHNALSGDLAAKDAELEESSLKYSSLQQIMSARPSRRDSIEKRRSRNLSSPMTNGRRSQTPDAGRLRDIEQKLVDSQKEMQASQVKASEDIQALSYQQTDIKPRTISATSNRDISSPLPNGRRDSMRSTSKEVQVAQARAAEAEKQLSESTQNFKERLGQLEADYQSAVHYVKGTEKMLRRMKEELGKYKTANSKLQHQLDEKELGTRELSNLQDANGSKFKELEGQLSAITTEKESMATELTRLRDQFESTKSAHNEKLSALEQELSTHKQASRTLSEHSSKAQQLEDDLEEAHLATQKLEFENRELERGMQESEAKVKMLLDQFEQSVDTYRRQSMLMTKSPTEETYSGTLHSHQTSDANDDEAHTLAPPILSGNPRTSSALDLLANELDQLRAHWESNARNSTYRSPEIGSDVLDSSDLFKHESHMK